MEQKIIDIFCEVSCYNKELINKNTQLRDTDVNSITIIQIIVKIEQEFGIEVDESEQEKYMEVNKMLSMVDDYFPPETGLYKKGARFDQKITLLFFNFPITAVTKYKDKIAEFESETG